MNMSELQQKEIVDIALGKRIGSIVDIIVDDKGKIIKLILDKRFSRRLIKNSREDEVVYWSQIVKIGDDIILVNTQNKEILEG